MKTDRKQQILHCAVEIICNQGYSALSMRALARSSGIKLGALQYHFPTWKDLLQALAAYINERYASRNETDLDPEYPQDLKGFLQYIFDDKAGESLYSVRLFPQLWAMAQVEPIMAGLLEEMYGLYRQNLEQQLKNIGSSAPLQEALVLISFFEGSNYFVGREGLWPEHRQAVFEKLLAFVDDYYS